MKIRILLFDSSNLLLILKTKQIERTGLKYSKYNRQQRTRYHTQYFHNYFSFSHKFTTSHLTSSQFDPFSLLYKIYSKSFWNKWKNSKTEIFIKILKILLVLFEFPWSFFLLMFSCCSFHFLCILYDQSQEMPYTRKKRKAKDSFSTKPNATLYLGYFALSSLSHLLFDHYRYVDDNESVEEIMKKFQVLDEIEQNKKKELVCFSTIPPNSRNSHCSFNSLWVERSISSITLAIVSFPSNQTEQVELSDKDLEEIFHKTSSYAIEAVIDNSYFSDEYSLFLCPICRFYSDEYSEDDDDDEWSIKYSYGTQYQHLLPS